MNPSLLIFLHFLIITSFFSCSPASEKSSEETSSVTFHTNFEGGNLGNVEQVAASHWRCALTGEADWDNRNRQVSWYYFRVEGAKDKALTIDLTDLVGEYNYKPGSHAITSETRPVISYDQQNWRHLSDAEVAWDDENVELRLNIKPEKDTIWVAHQPPYTTKNLQSLLAAYAGHPNMKMHNIGHTADGREMQQLTITNPNIPLSQKKVIWLMARQHSWEAGTSWVMESAIRYLLDSTKTNGLLDKVVFQILPMADPDGVARGGVRFNKFGHDLNRNWDLVKPEEMPEIHAQKQAIVNWLSVDNPIDLFITLHNTESADYIQGPDLAVGEKLWSEMVASPSFESEEGVRKMPASTTNGKPGRMTVNQALWAEMNLPAYLMELKVEEVGKLDKRRSVQDWLALGPGLVQAAATALE